MSGWPSTIKEIPPVLQPYWTFQEEFTIEDGLILKGTRIVIPWQEMRGNPQPNLQQSSRT